MDLTAELLKLRRTKIVATLGPASSSPGTVEDLVAAGVDVFRVDLSTHGGMVACRTVRRAGEAAGVPTTVLADGCHGPDGALHAVDMGADLVIVTALGPAADLRAVRAALPPEVGLVARIACPAAFDEYEAILDAADAVLIARTELGAAVSFDQVPVIQRALVGVARARSKPSIVAGEMLESMVRAPEPTRAEVSDVSTAVFSGADAVMLSAETSHGADPAGAVAVMDRIARQVEGHQWTANGFRAEGVGDERPAGVHQALALSTAQLSRDLRVRAIVVYSTTGRIARTIAAARPAAPVIVLAHAPWVLAQARLLWGTYPHRVTPAELSDFGLARTVTADLGLGSAGQRVLTLGRLGETDETAEITVLTL